MVTALFAGIAPAGAGRRRPGRTFALKWPMLRILGSCAVLGLGTVLLP
ncbi:hypothetical protein [Nonomuraea sp. NPDC003201]